MSTLDVKTATAVTPSRWSDLSSMTVLVTGASGGIGRATAAALAACGADLVLLARNADTLAQLRLQLIREHVVRVETIAADLTDRGQVSDSIRSLHALDALVNNAGQNIPQSIEAVDETNFDAIFDLNVKAAFFTAQACIAKFRERGNGGVIVNVSSQMGHVGARHRTVYCASKHALEGLTKSMAVELAGEAIRVNSVCPTFITTPLTAAMLDESRFRAEVISKIPLGRIGTTADVVAAIAFLLSPAAALVTGSSLMVDGGWTAQ